MRIAWPHFSKKTRVVLTAVGIWGAAAWLVDRRRKRAEQRGSNPYSGTPFFLTGDPRAILSRQASGWDAHGSHPHHGPINWDDVDPEELDPSTDGYDFETARAYYAEHRKPQAPSEAEAEADPEEGPRRKFGQSFIDKAKSMHQSRMGMFGKR